MFLLKRTRFCFTKQISLHLRVSFKVEKTGIAGEHVVPIPHLGVIVDIKTWMKLAKKLKESNIEFLIKPSVRFKGGSRRTKYYVFL